MDRKSAVRLWEEKGLDQAAGLFWASKKDFRLYADYLGCQNLIYEFEHAGRQMILRVSFRSDRTFDMVFAEVDFVNYLADQGARVSRALPSKRGNLVEAIALEDQQFIAVTFEKARGMRVPDNQYRYREGVSIDEYCQNWGQTLGKMHRLSRQYVPPSQAAKRPDWLDAWSEGRVDQVMPASYTIIRQKYSQLLNELHALPQNGDGYGLIHSDFNDGNFCVDYENGDITVFDFDDACYGWFMYELACAWEGFVGRAMFESDVVRRQERMKHFYNQVLEGYSKEYVLPDAWMEKLPTFLKAVEMESLLVRLEYWHENQIPMSQEDQKDIDYLVHCIQNDVPYLGLFSAFFSHEHPFRLV